MQLSVDTRESIEACARSSNDSAGWLALDQVNPKLVYVLRIHEVYARKDVEVWSFRDMLPGDEDDGHPGTSSA